MAIKKHPYDVVRVPISCHLYVPEDYLFALVHDSLHLSDRHIEFFTERFIAYAIDQASVHDLSVFLIENVFINRIGYFSS
jgi:hypothetical protein